MPVIIKGGSFEIKVLALLDDGSDVTLIDHEVARRIGAVEGRSSINLVGLNQTELGQSCCNAKFSIRGVLGGEFHSISNAFTVKNLSFQPRSLSFDDLVIYPHLRNLRNLQIFPSDVPKVLIGQDNRHLIDAQKIVCNSPLEPAASLTLLGWVVHGVDNRNRKFVHCLNSTFASQSEESDRDLHNLVKSYFALDLLGIQKRPRITKCDDRALDILKNTTRFVNGKWETGLLWKTDSAGLSNNYSGAFSRLRSIEAKLDKNPKLAEMYYREMDRLFSEGYAVKVDETELPPDGSFWYIPHFGAEHPNKPDKIRVVWDAAYRFNGTSLNDCLLAGPDLINNLFSVSLRFRVGFIAIKSDISDMYMRVSLKKTDQNFQLFLYRGRNRSQKPKIGKMTCLIFGSASSPCSAMYVKNSNAERFASQLPEAAKSTIEDTYVDDYLKSVNTVAEAKKLQRDVACLNSQAGFKMKYWSSNCKALASCSSQNASSVDLNAKLKDQALGIQWDTITDCFTFQIRLDRLRSTVEKLRRVPTKREMLRVIMSVYDPSGYLSPVSVKAKILLQNVWRRGTSWDESLHPDDYRLWLEWLSDLFATKIVKIPRCLFKKSNKTLKIELHTFCDAGEKAFATVVYIRVIYDDQSIQVRFIASKNFVAPLKPLSIPRLELQAAVAGARLAHSVLTSLKEIKFDSRTFWSDSRVVLCWIRCDPRNYQTYVANRLGEIDELTDPGSWRWVPSEINVADSATKVKFVNLAPTGEWFSGPRFLSLDESHWPAQLKLSEEEFIQKSKVESRKIFNITVKSDKSEVLPEFSRFSRFSRLLGATARVFTARSVWLSRVGKASPTFEVSVDNLLLAENAILKQAQRESFPVEISELSAGRAVPKNSRILILTPKLVDGLLRVQGRASNFQGDSAFCNDPIILDGDHLVSRLLVYDYHCKFNHANSETVINELRQKFWITKLRSILRSVVTKCAMCQLRRAKPTTPRMGDLPIGRVTYNVNPFSHCGVDYFGPITVTVGRRREKRYGVLFTCLSMRAVHLEIANSLTADSAIMAIMRMSARRGQPSVLYSDNGTNLRGASEEFSVAFKNIDQEKLRDFGTRNFIKWEFNPPSAPHMGGIWEIMVKSVKNALKSTLETEHPNEEVLKTLFAEAEHTVNSRPLYYVSSDPSDPEAITPNHLLFGASSRGMLPRRYDLLERSPRK